MQCRIATTFNCNLSCDYCCMKTLPQIKDSFSQSTLDDIIRDSNTYDSYVITGGEPLLRFDRVLKIVRKIKKITFFNEGNSHPQTPKVFLHTNGILLNKNTAIKLEGLVDGINISIHENTRDFEKYDLISQIIPIKLHVWEKLVDDKIREYLDERKFAHKIWKLDECDTVPEKRFLLTD